RSEGAGPRQSGPLLFWGPMKKTIVYVDGFNLYYGSLKKTPYRWLDMRALFKALLNPDHDIKTIKYFTARVSATEDNPDVHVRQDAYLRAVVANDPSVEIIEGHYLSSVVHMKLATPPAKGKAFVEVIKREEKGSDVNLAVHLLNDAWRKEFEAAVVVSNDSDLAESLRLVRRLSKFMKIIVLTPGCPPKRHTSAQLKRWANGTRYISAEALAASQLPNPVLDGDNPIYKPSGW